jgi:hypothetical protein
MRKKLAECCFSLLCIILNIKLIFENNINHENSRDLVSFVVLIITFIFEIMCNRNK